MDDGKFYLKFKDRCCRRGEKKTEKKNGIDMLITKNPIKRKLIKMDE